MRHNNFKTYPLLRPVGWIYSRVMAVRNRWFDSGRLKTTAFGLPVISVGNISAGGTGKTPMCAYLLQSLSQAGHSPALLSRGYGRRTKGFRQVAPGDTAALVGDEPLELYKRCGGKVAVYVCEDRCEGARQIVAANQGVDALVLDDAYQHRYIARDLNILLTDYSRLYAYDRVLPEGLLRESPREAERADIVVVTKCPASLSQSEADEIAAELRLEQRQRLFFTTVRYAEAANFVTQAPLKKSAEDLKDTRVLVFTGIAQPTPLIDHYKSLCRSVATLHFGDHHAFSAGDIDSIARAAASADVIITTAKDLQRLPADLPGDLGRKLYVQHIAVDFLLGRQGEFDDAVATALNK